MEVGVMIWVDDTSVWTERDVRVKLGLASLADTASMESRENKAESNMSRYRIICGLSSSEPLYIAATRTLGVRWEPELTVSSTCSFHNLWLLHRTGSKGSPSSIHEIRHLPETLSASCSSLLKRVLSR
jgi:hypothetical protein